MNPVTIYNLLGFGTVFTFIAGTFAGIAMEKSNAKHKELKKWMKTASVNQLLAVIKESDSYTSALASAELSRALKKQFGHEKRSTVL